MLLGLTRLSAGRYPPPQRPPLDGLIPLFPPPLPSAPGWPVPPFCLQELAACCRAGVEGSHVAFRRRAGGESDELLLLPGGLNLQPLRLLQGLAEAVTRRGEGRVEERRGGCIHDNFRVEGWWRSGAG